MRYLCIKPASNDVLESKLASTSTNYMCSRRGHGLLPYLLSPHLPGIITWLQVKLSRYFLTKKAQILEGEE
jgi:hypothetical protein